LEGGEENVIIKRRQELPLLLGCKESRKRKEEKEKMEE